ncbi:tetrahydromethanopterin S-methyltransferase subunit G [Streptomyces sp. B1I3]|nr:tetrahydromethanopterin S-methyltransferase subunit G [Streptomyces sp. B1I3]
MTEMERAYKESKAKLAEIAKRLNEIERKNESA